MTTGSRDVVLGRIRSALAADPTPTAIPRGYRRSGDLEPGGPAVLELLVDRLVDYKAQVHRCTPGGVAAAVDAALGRSRTVVVPPGLPAELADACASAGRTVIIDGDPTVLSPVELDRIDAVVTCARIAIALSGTIILDGQPDQGRRAITLVPDRHVVILHAHQVVETVPEALAPLDPTRPLTMIAGPSATSDIELERVEGVHGPRTLEVILIR